jgi:hypothetical protein
MALQFQPWQVPVPRQQEDKKAQFYELLQGLQNLTQGLNQYKQSQRVNQQTALAQQLAQEKMLLDKQKQIREQEMYDREYGTMQAPAGNYLPENYDQPMENAVPMGGGLSKFMPGYSEQMPMQPVASPTLPEQFEKWKVNRASGPDLSQFTPSEVSSYGLDRYKTLGPKTTEPIFQNRALTAKAAAELREKPSKSLSASQYASIFQGDPMKTAEEFGDDGIPIDVARMGVTARGQAGIQGRFDTGLGYKQELAGATQQAKSDAALQPVKEARGFFGVLKSKYEELNKMGLAGNPAVGTASKWGARLTGGAGSLAKVNAYEDVRRGMIGRLKKLTLDTGVLTDTDAARLERLMPFLNESMGSVNEKMDIINQMLAISETGELDKLSTFLERIGIKTDGTNFNGSGATGRTGAAAGNRLQVMDFKITR